ncbi:hypothetical protein GCM10009577_65450 [Streptomyces javensis]
MFNVRKLLAGACTASLAAGGLVLGSVATAAPAQANAVSCYRYIEGLLKMDDRDEAQFYCSQGESIVFWSKCVNGLDKLDGVNEQAAKIGCRKALD